MKIISDLNQNELLVSFIEFHKCNFVYDPLVVWNLEHKCLYASAIYLAYIGMEDLNGKLLADVSEEYAILSNEFRSKVTLKVLESKKPHQCFLLLYNRLSNDYGMYQACVFPIFDRENNLIAYCSRTHQIRHDMAVFNMMQAMSPYKKKNPLLRIKALTEREKMVVFLLIIGFSHKEIAEVLTNIYTEPVSSSSISVMISRQIYPKFDTSQISTLIHRAILSGFLYNVPRLLVEKLPRIIFVEDYAALCQRLGLAPLD